MPGGRVRLRDGLVVRVRGARGVSSARSLCCAGVVAARVSPPELGNFVSACRVPLKPWRLPHSGFVQFSFRFCLLEHLLCLLGGGAQRTGNERRRKPPPSLPRPCWPAAVMSGSPFSLKRLLVCRRGPHAQRRVAPDGVVVLGPGGPRGPDLRPDAELVQRPQLELQRGVPRLDDRAVQRRAGPLPQRWSRRTAEVRIS
jgi:hypothetical protein